MASGRQQAGGLLAAPPIHQSLVDRGYAEVHVHLGASLPFAELWQRLRRSIVDGSVRAEDLRAPGAPFDEGRHLHAWILRGLLVERLLRTFLAQPPVAHDTLAAALADFDEHRANTLSLLERDALCRAVAEVQAGRLHDTGIHNDDHLAVVARALHCMADVTVADDLQVFWAQPRRRPDDRLFWQLATQVLRIQCIVYRGLVHRPLQAGLQMFVRSFQRIKPARRSIGKKELAMRAADFAGAGRGLRSLEVRECVAPSRQTLLNELIGYEEVALALAEKNVAFGLTYHFARRRGGGHEEGRPNAHWRDTHADPNAETSGGRQSHRFQILFRQLAEEARTLGWLLQAYPLALRLVRGLDVCTDEAGVPIWVMRPLFRYVRRAADAAVATLLACTGIRLPSLRCCPHAGEDFQHLQSGLRRIDETVTHLGLRQGDRLGHALALGIDPLRWASAAGRVAMPLEDRYFDLLWEWDVLSEHSRPSAVERTAFVRRRVWEVGNELFAQQHPFESHVALYRDLHKTSSLSAGGFGSPAADVGGMLHRFLHDASLFGRGRGIISVPTAEEAEALRSLQTSVRHKVAERGIAIEINPSSNLLIGDLADLSRHPVWRLQQAIDDAPALRVCLGSDDPTTFATSLPEEYALLHDSLMSNGLSAGEAADRLEQIRACGMDYRFTLDPARLPAPGFKSFVHLPMDSYDPPVLLA